MPLVPQLAPHLASTASTRRAHRFDTKGSLRVGTPGGFRCGSPTPISDHPVAERQTALEPRWVNKGEAA